MNNYNKHKSKITAVLFDLSGINQFWVRLYQKILKTLVIEVIEELHAFFSMYNSEERR